jgi:hypothetical protein
VLVDPLPIHTQDARERRGVKELPLLTLRDVTDY